MSDTTATTCQTKVGLLTLRDCDQPAEGACEQCKRVVCSKHRITSETGILCPECALAAKEQQKKTAQVKTRHRYYTSYHYYPYYYGHHHHYHDYDYRSFEDGAAAEGEAGGAGEDLVGEGGEFGGAGATGGWEEDAGIDSEDFAES